MTADAQSLRFYVDESALGIGKTLAAARKDTIHVGHPPIPECPVGVLDVDWIPVVAARDLVVIGRDKRIRTRPEELRKLRDAGLRVFWIGGKKDLSTLGLAHQARTPLDHDRRDRPYPRSWTLVPRRKRAERG